jgi:PAT family beta-lactamase induction signal transducer AmpG
MPTVKLSQKARRIGVNLFLGFSSGLPIALCGSTLQAWLSTSGVSLIEIGFATLIAQPYAYKFIWAPFMDKYLPPFLGKQRGWMLIAQLLIIFCLIFLSFLSPEHHLKILLVMGLLLAFFSASQDITIDAYRTEILEPTERGLGASLTTIGYRIALIASGGFALGIADYWGWKITYLSMSFCMLIGIIANLCAPEISPEKPNPQISASFWVSLWTPFLELFQKFSGKSLFYILLILIFYKFGDALVLALNSTFLLQDLHFSLLEVGLANKTIGLLSGIAGGLIGGLILMRMNLFNALILFGLLQAFSNFGFWFLAHQGHSFWLMIVVMGIDQFCSGLGTVALMAFLMTLCDKKYSATQYAVLSAIASLGRIYVGPLAAVLVKSIGWEFFYVFVFLLSFPGVVAVFGIKNFLKKD